MSHASCLDLQLKKHGIHKLIVIGLIAHTCIEATVRYAAESDLNKKIYETIETWRNRPIEGEHPYVYLDGIVMKRIWAGEVRNVSLLVAIAVNAEG